MKKWLRNGFSLKWGLITIMLAFWVLPFVIILSVMDYYASAQARQQVQKTIVNSVESAVEVTKNGIKNAMDMMRSDTFETNIEDAYFQFLVDGDKTSFHQSITQNLKMQYSGNNNFITSMIYFTKEPDTIYYIGNHLNENALEHMQIYEETMHPTIKAIQNQLGEQHVRFLAYDNTLYMIHALSQPLRNPYAVLVMEVNEEQLFRGLYSVVWLSSARVKIDNVKINAKGIGVKMPKEYIMIDDLMYAEDNHTVRVKKQNEIENHEVVYLLAVDSSPLWECFSAFNKMLVPIALSFIPLVLVVIWMFYKHISKPVESMVSAAEEVQKGHLGYQIKDQPHSREFRYMIDNFNNMSRDTKEQFERSYNEQVALQNERIKALQSQINPHFLHNTLEIINWEARKEDNESVCDMIEALGTMLSAAMLRNGKTKACLREELEVVDAYLFIISVRMGSGLMVNKFIDHSLEDVIVPCMILQPVVENAVEHGIRPNQSGVITIRVYQDQDMITMEVENDGFFDAKHQANIDRLLAWDGEDDEVVRSSEVGIRNVNYRLKLLYGERAGLAIYRTDSDTTMAKITLPRLSQAKSTTSVNKCQPLQL